MGMVNMDGLDEFLEVNKRNYDAYQAELSGIRGLKLQGFDDAERCNRQYIVVEVGDDYPLTRDELVAKLSAENVRARRYFWPGCHRMEPYRSLQPNAGMLLSVTEEVAGRIVVLPTGTTIDRDSISLVCDFCSQ